MTLLGPQISNSVQQELNRALEMDRFIIETVPQTMVHDSERKTLFSAYFATVRDLFLSVIHLVQAGGSCDGGAFALLRPILDSALRGQWLFFCASDEVVIRAHAGDQVTPGLPAMIEAIHKHIAGEVQAGSPPDDQPGDENPNIYSSWLRISPSLHGFTHGGAEQLSRRFDQEGNLRPSYSDELKIELLRAAAQQMNLIAALFCKVHTLILPQDDPHAQLIEAKWEELYVGK